MATRRSCTATSATSRGALKMKHTQGAPDRILAEGPQYLTACAESQRGTEVEVIRKAMAWEIPKSDSEDGGWVEWLKRLGVTRRRAEAALALAEGQARSL